MADEIILSKPVRELHPDGTFAALCVDLIDLGMRVTEFSGRKSASQSCVLVFGTGEKDSQGREMFLSREFNVSMGAKASLRKFLETWRGKAFTAEEQQRFALSVLVGKPALLTVQHHEASGNVYANLVAAAPLAKGMAAPVIGGYTRAPFWEQRKSEYKAKYAEFTKTGVPAGDASYHGPIEKDDDDPLPF